MGVLQLNRNATNLPLSHYQSLTIKYLKRVLVAKFKIAVSSYSKLFLSTQYSKKKGRSVIFLPMMTRLTLIFQCLVHQMFSCLINWAGFKKIHQNYKKIYLRKFKKIRGMLPSFAVVMPTTLFLFYLFVVEFVRCHAIKCKVLVKEARKSHIFWFTKKSIFFVWFYLVPLQWLTHYQLMMDPWDGCLS